MKAMMLLIEDLCNAPVLKMLDISDGAAPIVVWVDTNLQGLGVIFQQHNQNKDRHLGQYQSKLWIKAEKQYNLGKCECCGRMKSLK
jgi:hypothetical protein